MTPSTAASRTLAMLASFAGVLASPSQMFTLAPRGRFTSDGSYVQKVHSHGHPGSKAPEAPLSQRRARRRAERHARRQARRSTQRRRHTRQFLARRRHYRQEFQWSK